MNRESFFLVSLLSFALIAAAVGVSSILQINRILDGAVAYGEVLQKDEIFRGISTSPNVPPDELRLNYAFEVNGARHIATNRVSESLWAQMQPGDPIAVYYLPDEPAASLVEPPEKGTAARMPFLISLACAAAAGGLALNMAYVRAGRDV